MRFLERLKKDLTGYQAVRFVLVNNFEVEKRWAVGEPKLPGAGIAFADATVNRMEEMGVLLADEGDVVVLKAPLDVAFADYLASLGALAGRVLCAECAEPDRTITEDALASPGLLSSLGGLSDGQTYLMPMGTSAPEEMLAAASGLPLAGPGAEICKAVNGKIFSRRLVEELGLTAVPGRICETVGELREVLNAHLATGGRAVVKESLGVSGRGMTVLDSQRSADRLLRLIERRGPEAPARMVVESWIEGAQDLNYQFVVSRTGEVRFETVKAAVLRGNVHQGHRFPVDLPPAMLAELHGAAQLLGRELHAAGYAGVVGVDAMIGADGRLYPCLEINARFNMSTYQSRIAERFVPAGAHAVAATFALRPSRMHTFDEVAHALGDALFDGTGRPGVLINNFATLNAGARPERSGTGGHHGRLYGICVADTAEGALSLRERAERRLAAMVAGAGVR
ncbi:ATP-grasp domain-containing protein [Streptomyces sp. AA0539]|uniref:preATP grasp domain-containing protein n=1 Tax=Streptomyces sp. AA0539 TaxID=1210045 RepID=UPI0002E709C8|nr:ATP-grasp domain-containing protein [Streptomyces sp. AA0539]